MKAPLIQFAWAAEALRAKAEEGLIHVPPAGSQPENHDPRIVSWDAEFIIGLPDPVLSSFLSHVTVQQTVVVLDLVGPERAIRILDTMDPHYASSVFRFVSAQQAAVFLNRMQPQQAAAVLHEAGIEQALAQLLAMDTARAARALHALPRVKQDIFLERLPPAEAASVLNPLDPALIFVMLKGIAPNRVGAILDHAPWAVLILNGMGLQSAAEVMNEMDARHAGRVLSQMEPERAGDVVGRMAPASAVEALSLVDADLRAHILQTGRPGVLFVGGLLQRVTALQGEGPRPRTRE